MDQTIDALENRLHGRHLLDELVGFFRRGDHDGEIGEWREKIGRSARSVVDSVKTHPIPILAIGAGVAWLIYENQARARRQSEDERERYDLEYTNEDYPSEDYVSGGSGSTEKYQEGSSSMASQAKEKISAFGNQAREKVSDLSERSREKLESARERVSELSEEARQRGREIYAKARERVVTTTEQHPLEVGLGFLAVGVIAGLLIPPSPVVKRRLEPAAERLREASSELFEKGKRVAQAAARAAKVEAKTQGLTVERVREQTGAVAQRAGEAATTAAKQEGVVPGAAPQEGPSPARTPA